MLEALAQRKRPGVAWVFARDDGQAPRDIECVWSTARRRADVHNFRFHDLWHIFASYMAMSGASLQDIAEVLGHKKLQQTLMYVHLMPSHTRDVVQRMIHKYLEEDQQ